MAELLYGSTRGGETGVTASQAVLKGLANDGGLYVPERIPTLDVTMDELAGMTYQETAYAVMKQFLTDYTEEELNVYLNTEEPYDKAGAYAIQGIFSKYIDHYEGSYDTVVGFPIEQVKARLIPMLED